MIIGDSIWQIKKAGFSLRTKNEHMKKILFSILILLCSLWGLGQDTIYDARAIEIIDRMSETIGELTSCSFQVKSSEDKPHVRAGYLREYATHEVFLAGPDKMHIFSKKPKEKYAYWYNGDLMMYYSFTYNHYGFMETPDNIRETIDLVHNEYGVDFPAADFFYPTLTDDLMESSDYIGYEGLTEVDGQECYYIVAKGADKLVQLWISSGSFTLPVRYTVQDNKNEKLQFEGIFSNWQINPNLPDALFDFTVPTDARRLQIIPKSLRY
jgi:hypothetical protein